MRRILLPATFALALCLAGCAAPEPPEPGPLTDSSPQPSTPAPRELSDEEALTIAVETYEVYMELSKTVLVQGHDDERVLDSVTTGVMLERNAGTRELAASDSWQFSGSLEVTNGILVTVAQDGDTAIIVAEICSDQSGLEIRHGDGSLAETIHDSDVLGLRITVHSSSTGNTLADLEMEAEHPVCEF